MKRSAKYRSHIVWLSVLMIMLCGAAGFAKGRSSATPNSLIHQRNFIFRADWVIAYTGDRKHPTPPYELLVTSDSIDCYLPFPGRVYTVPTPQELRFMSIRFISKKFNYMEHADKRFALDITITPADAHNVQELYFSISRKGRAGLTILPGWPRCGVL